MYSINSLAILGENLVSLNISLPPNIHYTFCFMIKTQTEQSKHLVWHWDPIEERIYSKNQFLDLTDKDVKNRCLDIMWVDWMEFRQNVPPGKHIGSDPKTGYPAYIEDPGPTEEDLLRQEKEEKEHYLRSTNTEMILYLQTLLIPQSRTLSNSISTDSLNTLEEISKKRLEYYSRIKEIDSVLNSKEFK